jgi:allophanate hydrolase subunit 1
VISTTPPLATLHELQTIYGSEDLADLLEVAAVNAHNQREAIRRANRN